MNAPTPTDRFRGFVADLVEHHGWALTGNGSGYATMQHVQSGAYAHLTARGDTAVTRCGAPSGADSTTKLGDGAADRWARTIGTRLIEARRQRDAERVAKAEAAAAMYDRAAAISEAVAKLGWRASYPAPHPGVVLDDTLDLRFVYAIGAGSALYASTTLYAGSSGGAGAWDVHAYTPSDVEVDVQMAGLRTLADLVATVRRIAGDTR